MKLSTMALALVLTLLPFTARAQAARTDTPVATTRRAQPRRTSQRIDLRVMFERARAAAAPRHAHGPASDVGRCDTSAECSGTTPVCDIHASRCTACESDTECVAEGRSVCSQSGLTQGMCVAPAPEVTSPADGNAIHAGQRVVEGRGAPGTMVVVLVDNRVQAGAVVGADGRFTCELPEMEGGWHQVTAAHVESGVIASPGEGRRVFAAGCLTDSECGDGRRCALESLTCVAR